jgi:hypothetical protein
MTHTFTRAIALAAVTGAAAAPAASAMVPPPDDTTTSVVQPAVAASNASDGFHVGDAAIGAGAAVLVLLVGSGGTLALRRARHPHMPPAAGA